MILPVDGNDCVCLCREILNEERCPGFLLEAVRSAIKKKRKLIKAKMLGIPVNECSSRSLWHTFIISRNNGVVYEYIQEHRTQFYSQFLLCCCHFFSFSDEEERSSLFGQTEVDGTTADETDKPAESRIQNLWVQLLPALLHLTASTCNQDAVQKTGRIHV